MAKAKDNRFSDVDLGVLVDSPIFQKDYFEIESMVATEMERGFSGRELDIRVLNSAPLYFQYQVIKTGKVIFCADDKKRVNFEMSVMREYFDIRHNLIEYDKYMYIRAEGKLIKMAGFRNVLIREYRDILIEKVYDILQNRLSDFYDFAQAALDYLKKYES